MNRATFFAALLAVLLCVPGQAQKSSRAELLFESARQKETLEGDLKGAIREYEEIVKRHSSEWGVAAKALIAMAECHQKLGDGGARTIYERVLREYGDQKEAVTLARARLGIQGRDSMVARRVWAGAEVNSQGSVSADGRLLSYIDWETGDLAIHDLQTGESRRLTQKGSWKDSPDFAEASSVSADGRQVAYEWYTDNHKDKEEYYDLRVARTIGGAEAAKPRVIYRSKEAEHIHPVGWLPDGRGVLAYTYLKDRTHQIILLNASDGTVKVLKSFDWRSANKLSSSPDGRYIAYDFPPSEDSPQHDVYVLAVDGSREVRAVEDPADDLLVGWAPDGNALLFLSDRTGRTDMWAVPVSEGKPSAPPELVKRDIGRITPLGLSSKGALYYGIETGIRDVYTVTIDPESLKPVGEPLLAAQRFLGTNMGPDWSPDGKYVAYASRRGQAWDSPSVICIRSVASGTEREVVPKLASIGAYYGIRWSPDGRFIFARGIDRNGREGLYRINVQTGDTDSVARGITTPPVWSPDGRTMYFLRGVFGQEQGMKIIALNTGDGSEKELFRLPTGYFGHLAISPNGKHLAFVDNADRSHKSQRIMLLPTEGGEPRILVEAPIIAGFALLVWAPDGDQLLFAKPGAPKKLELWRVSVSTGEQFFVADYASENNIRAVRISPDGRKLAYTFGQTQSEVWVLENFLPTLSAKK